MTSTTRDDVLGAHQPASGLLDRVRDLAPQIRAASSTAELQRAPDDQVIDGLKATGVFRALVPARYGGYEIDLDEFLEIGLVVSEACPSTGWLTTFYMEHNWLLTMFPDELQDRVFGEHPYVLAPGSVNPKGVATPTDGGYELSGHWQFGTGIVHADWVLLSGRIDAETSPLPRLFLVARDAVEVIDTWHVDGMAATGSRDIVAKGIHVPEVQVSLAVPPMLTAGPDATYLMRLPLAPLLSLTAGIPALGSARRALSLFRERLSGRVLFGTSKAQSQRGPTQVRLANVTCLVSEAEIVLRSAAHAMTEHARGRAELTMLEQMQMRLLIARAVHHCRDAVRICFEASGASAHYLDQELQRIHRDVHMICAHTVFDLDLVAEQVGRLLVEVDGST